eukprot:CAMPEP_0170539124 /NCGR_PEP_ID=MMETSP0209-20121228/103733_1 /TAXON_ID=665100 ORGANISM="Litonotus pictus, Strain P1" /NCGR_SAMPLE_ID=MMETSP0209 /ASSEMBLY_ACC=CAM_ASM_000301 /LENGTH=95 /DNA_ID=CAMNT_0010840967 /DNA_START=1156 /DNA_END=1440 /DNA_ORIENTATION=+
MSFNSKYYLQFSPTRKPRSALVECNALRNLAKKKINQAEELTSMMEKSYMNCSREGGHVSKNSFTGKYNKYGMLNNESDDLFYYKKTKTRSLVPM